MIDLRSLLPDESPPIELLLEADPSRSHIEAYLRSGHCGIAVEEGGRAVGVYVTIVCEDGIAELVNVAVCASRRGEGLGKRLVRHAAERALRAGARILRVGTGNSSLAALALYQKCGFRVTGVERDYYLRHYAEAIVEDGIPCRDRINLELDLEEAGF